MADDRDYASMVEMASHLANPQGAGNPLRITRKAGLVKLREAMGGEPAFFGPINRGAYGVPLKGRPQEDVRRDMDSQATLAEIISQAVPR